MAIIFDGPKVAGEIKERLLQAFVSQKEKLGRSPKVVVFQMGDDDPSSRYVEKKSKMAQSLGVEFEVRKFLGSDDDTLVDFKKEIVNVCQDNAVDGVMVQLPLYLGDGERVSTDTTKQILESIDPKKDIDGLSGKSKFLPAAVRGVLEIINSQSAIINSTMKLVVVGNHGMVGRKVESELLKLGFEVRGMDKDDFDPEILKSADVVVSCTGQHGLITGDFVKDGVAVVDVGFPKGDVDFEVVKDKASFITPVPGGVGPMTVVSLFSNLLDALND